MVFIEHDFRVDVALQSLKRKLAKTQLQVLPINPDILKSLVLFMDLNKNEDQALWASFLVAFYCMFRKKSLVPETMHKFNSATGLSRIKISMYPEQNLALVYANFAKNIQFCERDIVIPLIAIPNSVLCPVTALQNLFDNNQVPAESPAFSYLKNGKLCCIT